MKKFIQNHSNAIILTSFCLIFTIIFLAINNTSSEQYMRVTVSEGDSLWTIAERYAAEHSLSNHEFIKWVVDENDIIGDTIHPGEQLIIPVHQSNGISTELADSGKE